MLGNMIPKVGNFYVEVLRHPALTVTLPKAIRAKAVKKAGKNAKITMDQQDALYEEAMNRFFDRKY